MIKSSIHVYQKGRSKNNTGGIQFLPQNDERTQKPVDMRRSHKEQVPGVYIYRRGQNCQTQQFSQSLIVKIIPNIKL
uniref:SFRICE_024365 n=1 Tax=Spodoptera frugiperda TaxID=7108 RepID=A0A2H1W0L3_SPOFR